MQFEDEDGPQVKSEMSLSFVSKMAHVVPFLTPEEC